ncbi:uncharacterized protein K460DRAFT_350290 [Cucurbitaria berberidis CBS 394.84]|uniref:Secreted protein n=1 Tax=Cucurbitaria berberidis CBS 394.84 TaxID=1168544 RepID=A0A9P4LCZ4_9PLEO|nr:uncharacterized protein K460DRAFT_350290 [Cucurbitaria berberidis CBS 394.84]KAF1850208.1 hypothetical protein K460DRAFT_350290 [Cucurbitaria berberidis CBS 394.84]
MPRWLSLVVHIFLSSSNLQYPPISEFPSRRVSNAAASRRLKACWVHLANAIASRHLVYEFMILHIYTRAPRLDQAAPKARQTAWLQWVIRVKTIRKRLAENLTAHLAGDVEKLIYQPVVDA